MCQALFLTFALVIVPDAVTSDIPPNPSTSRVDTTQQLLDQARAKMNAREWAEASKLWDQLVQQNPLQPTYWNGLATARYNARDYRAAITAYQKTAELGGPPMGAYYALYQVARCHARLGETEPALNVLEKALTLGYPDIHGPARDPELASLRDQPRFKKLLWLDDVKKMTREEGWRYDLGLLAHEARRKGFNPHLYVNRTVTREQFDAKVRELHDAIPTMSDEQIMFALTRLMVFLDDGHTAVWVFPNHPMFSKALPLRFFWFEEGMFVVAAAPEQKELLGAQVLAMDGKRIDALNEAMLPYINRDRGNPIKPKVSLAYMIRNLPQLHALGITKNADRVTLSIRDLQGQTRDVEVAASDKDLNIWNTLPAPSHWVTYTSTLPAPPHYVQHMDRLQWFEYLPEQKTLYFQFNRVRNDDKETLEQFSQRLFKFINENDVEKLIIDMRWNNGGNTFLGHPMLLGLIANPKINQRGKLFVIIGRRTYSAAQNMSTYFERFTNATFVGEPTGSSPNFVGEEVPVTLPYSKGLANISHLFWQSAWPQDQRVWLAPHVYVPPTFADYRTGRDAALEAILGPIAPKTAQQGK